MEEYAQGKGPMATGIQMASAHLPFPGIRTAEWKKDLDELLQRLGGMKTTSNSRMTPDSAAAHEAYARASLADPEGAPVICLKLPFLADASQPQGRHLTVALLFSHPLSPGSVYTSMSTKTATGNNGLAINPGYLLHPLDVEVLARHVLYLEKSIAGAEPLASHLKPREDVLADLETAKERVKSRTIPGNNFTGGCCMMPWAMGVVVDEKLRVHGCANLRVYEASIVPLSPRTNTQATAYGVAEMRAGFIKESL